MCFQQQLIIDLNTALVNIILSSNICLGTCYLAKKMVSNIKKKQPNLEVTERDIFNVSVAGLCHDLGHGPFSHVFDNFFMNKVK